MTLAKLKNQEINHRHHHQFLLFAINVHLHITTCESSPSSSLATNTLNSSNKKKKRIKSVHSLYKILPLHFFYVQLNGSGKPSGSKIKISKKLYSCLINSSNKKFSLDYFI